MPSSTIHFVCGFLPCCLFVYWLAPARLRNSVALAFSVAFYAWGAPRFLPVVLALGVADFFLARAVARSSGRRKVALLVAALTVHVGVLAYFKYSNFAVAQLNSVAALLDAKPYRWAQVALPIGISFLTFEEISYLVDVYRGDAAPAKRGGHYLLFLMLFPHSIAGPIFRWKDLAAQFEGRVMTSDAVWNGVARFSFGLAKKILVADSAAIVADWIFGLPKEEVSAAAAWLAATAYAVQIYFDFSGYSDMAIGLGAMLGFTFKENFREPYISVSLAEFWQRWHISLSSWLRDYIYIPLGGNRKGPVRAELNAMAVFAVSGLWHGAAWNFLAWGVYHGLLVALERRAEPVLGRIPKIARCVLTFVLVVIGWVLFRARDMAQAGTMLATMFGLHRQTVEPKWLEGDMYPRVGMLAIGGALVFVIIRMTVRVRDEKRTWEPPTFSRYPALSLALLAASIMHMANTRYMPLIYFKF
jgi:alginate O-acetyltransferase complex protein AlgI